MTRGKKENIKLSLPVSESRDHIQGSVTAPVTLVEYGDYECPYCAQAYLITKEIQERLGDKMCFVFRNFPLTKIRPHAYETALAAEAAAAQVNSGICMTIYSKMVRLSLRRSAASLGLNLIKFDS